LPSAASIAFPNSYNGASNSATLFIGIDTGANRGDIYQITSVPLPAPSTAKDLNIGSNDSISSVDVASLTISGSTILAGCARNARIYLSIDSGVSWTQSNKPPTGQTETCVLIAPDFANQHAAYAVTRGTESAFSYSSDGGLSWNQISLIDTKISDIPDIATPLTATTFILTLNRDNLKQSHWRTTDSGGTWDRIFCSSFTGIDNMKSVKTIPQYSPDSPIVLVVGQANSNPVIWKSNDNGQHFVSCSTPCSVDTISIVDNNTWFIGGYNGSKGLIYRTNNGGGLYSIPAEAGSQSLTAVVASPSYSQDKTVLAGNSIGQIYLSQDNGANFDLLGQALPLTSGIGRICLAYDSKFSENKIVYAATDAKLISTSKDRIFRFAIGQSSTWLSISGSLPDSAIIKQIVVANDGTLYAENTQSIVSAEKKGGVVRSLNPTFSSPTFETLLSGLDDTITLNKLSFFDNQLWVVDTLNIRLMTFVDSLALPMTLVSPEKRVSGLDTISLNLKWQVMAGATKYEWQVSDNASFTGLLSSFTGISDSSTVRLSDLEPATTYYWHVRTSNPYLSRWSETWSFTTLLGGTNVVPLLSIPAAGAKTTVKPVFQWSTIIAADRYDLLVAKDAAFNHIVIDKTANNALHSNAWESDINLENDTTYYWKIRARSDESIGTWSAVSVFVTESAPLPTTTSLGGNNSIPLLSVPAAGAKTTIKPVFQWSTIVSADRYDLLVAKDAVFSNVVIDKTANNAIRSNAWESDITLENDTTYYWKTRARSGSSIGAWSAVSIFVTESAPLPTTTSLGGSNSIPLLSVPAAGAKTTIKPVFQWSTIVSADRYDLLVAKDAAFSNIVVDKTGENALHSNAWESDINLENNTTYYWKTRARSEKDIGTWSAVSIFVTESAPLPATTTLGESNNEPLLSVPAAGARTTIKPVFQWSTIVSADRYDLLVAKDAAFSNIVVDKTGENALYSNAWESDINLENDTMYYWKTRTRSDDGIGTWSAVSVFVTEAASLPVTSASKALSPTDLLSQQTQTTAPPVNLNVRLNIPLWVIYLGVALLAIIAIMLVMLVITTIKQRH
jgi:photosystem II stability/assembly factor-like uncharacterized protein